MVDEPMDGGDDVSEVRQPPCSSIIAGAACIHVVSPILVCAGEFE